MKIVLTKPNRTQLLKIREQLAAALAQFNRETGATASLESERRKLTLDIAALEAEEKVTDDLVNRLGFKREKLRTIENRLREAENRAVDPMRINQLLTAFGAILRLVMRPTYDEIESRIQAELRPHFPNGGVPSHIIADSPRMAAYINFMSRSWGFSESNAAGQGRDAIQIIDKLLKGQVPFPLPR